MDRIFSHSPSLFVLGFALFIFCRGISGATITLVNKCNNIVWPGILGNTPLDTSGFELAPGGSRSFQAPPSWSGRFWGRTGCTFDPSSGQGTCRTGDCGSNQLECNGRGASPPATLAEFTIGSGCVSDLNRRCPSELRVESGEACKSACEAFGTPEYCCSGEYGTPSTCKPSVYSQIFKTACPRSYSYAYDDATSTFTCTGADYTITFCPSSTSKKSVIGITTGSGDSSAEDNSSWLPKFSTGDSSRSHFSLPISLAASAITFVFLPLFYL